MNWPIVRKLGIWLFVALVIVSACEATARTLQVRFNQEQADEVTGYRSIGFARHDNLEPLLEVDKPRAGPDGVRMILLEGMADFEDVFVAAMSRDASGAWSDLSNEIYYPALVCGDVDGSGVLDIGDVVAILIQASTNNDACDVSGDGLCGAADALEVRRMLAGLAVRNICR